jgi:hypothetical protein
MPNPSISKYVRIIEMNREFKAIAAIDIPENTIIEICPVLLSSAKAIISLINSDSKLSSKIIIDEAAVDKEYQVFAELGEMELERRLNLGQISEDEYSQILRSKVNINSLLNAKTHGLPLGNGLIYGISDFPNMVREYHSSSKLCVFRSVQYIVEGSELTYSK